MIRPPWLCALALALCFVMEAQPPRRGPGGRSTAPESEQHPPIPRNDAEKRILDIISAATKAGDLYANVPASDGRMLRILTESVNAKHVVEIGTSTGLSGMWFAMALQKTGGKLTTFELDAQRAATARKHFQQAGVDRIVTIVEGDAHQNITKLKEPIDVVFIDAEKDGYVDYLNKLLPLVRPGGLILAHNIEMVRDYVKEVTARAELDTVFYTSGGGLGVSLKKR
jgi:predicted O-methyltransferase YrrM